MRAFVSNLTPAFLRWLLVVYVISKSTALLQGPTFKVEPLPRIDFANSTTSIVDCIAEGTPEPTVTWITMDGSKADQIDGLRYVFPNGTLLFRAFKAEEYRQDVHAAVYQCVASSSVGIIKSRPVQVRAVVQQYYEVQVYDEFVILGNTAVLKCNVPTFVKDYVSVVDWLKSDRAIIHPGPLSGNRYTLTSSGDLYVNKVENADSFGTYRCRTIHRLSGEKRLSASGRIVVSDSKSSVPPRITHSIPIVNALQGQNVEMPCAAQGLPIPTYRWWKDDGKEAREIDVGGRFKQLDGILTISNVQVMDSGIYSCVASNNIGEEKIEITLRITASLFVRIDPQEISLDVGNSATFNCIVRGHPLSAVTWLKDGQILRVNDRVRLLTQYVLRIESIIREDKGMYQCFAKNSEETAQGSAQLNLGDVGPIFHQTFAEETIHPGTAVTLKCSASGNPVPDISWNIDGELLKSGGKFGIIDYVDSDGYRVSLLNISSVGVQDGGQYGCVSRNRVGAVEYYQRINVYGPPLIRPMTSKVNAVAGQSLLLPCRVAGFPISSITWEKDGTSLPVSSRQMTQPNGTLIIQNIDQLLDGGEYTCTAVNDRSKSVSQTVSVKVIVPPVIDSVTFPRLLVLRLEARARLQCVVTQGDLPISISWLKDGLPIKPDLSIHVRKDDEFSSVLTFLRISTQHSGDYTCFARNSGGAVNVTARITVEVPPSWIVPPSHTSTNSGGNVTVDCVADGYPRPDISWKKAVGRLTGEYRDVAWTVDHVKVLSNGSLYISGATEDDEGSYLCEASNGIGTAVSKVIQVKVHAAAHFVTKNQNDTVKKGDRASIQCEARGDMPLYITWARNNLPLDFKTNTRISKAERALPHGLLSEIIFEKTERRDEGIYQCTTWNTYGRDESTLILSVKEPPEAPDNVKIVEHGGRVVKLTWSHPFNGGSNIIHYIVQYKRASEEWLPQLANVTVPGSNNSAVVKGLLPGTPYSYRILARNALGVGNPSNGVGITTAEEAPNGPPLNVKVVSSSSESLMVTWKAPIAELSHGDILGYCVGYRPQNSSESFQFLPVELIKREKESSLKIGKLKKFTKYVIAVQAYNRMGKGPFSGDIVASTDEDVPERPPDNVQCWGQSSHSINVSWSPPSSQYRHGVVVGYKIFYSQYNEDDNNTILKSVAKTSRNDVTLHGLEKFTNYSVRVLSYTRIGDGETSDAILCSTLEDVPSAPEDIKALVKSASEVIAVWKPPLRPNGAIIKYTLYMRQPPDRKQGTKRYNVTFSKTFLEISGLEENQRYEFWVTASTLVGEGQSTKVVSQTPRSNVPAKIATFSEIITVQWSKDLILQCLYVGSPLPFVDWKKGNSKIGKASQGPSVENDGTLIIRKINRKDTGLYSCRVENIHGRDEVTYEIRVLAPPESPTLTVVKTTASTLYLNWKTKDDGGSTVKGYYIRYKREFGEWEETKVDRGLTSHALQNLQCGTHYQVSISAFNKIGLSQHSESVITSTKGSPPAIPKMDDILFPNISYANLRLSTWPNGGCPIHYFVLQYRPYFQRDWILISNNVQRQHDPVLISDLKPGERYDLLITAHNDAGSTVAKYQFSTLSGMLSSGVSINNGNDNVPFYEDISIVIPVIACAITTIIVLIGACIVIRRRRYAGYHSTKATILNLVPESGMQNTISESENTSGKKHDMLQMRSLCNEQVSTNSKIRKAHNVCHGGHRGGGGGGGGGGSGGGGGHDDICPYATFNLPGSSHEERAHCLQMQMKTFGMPDHFHPQSAKLGTYVPSKRNVPITEGDGGTSRGVLLRPQHFPSAEEMYPIRSSVGPNDYPDNTSTSDCRHRFFAIDKKYGSDWDLRDTPSSYINESESRIVEHNHQVPDLLYRGTDSSTPNDSSPEEVRFHRMMGISDVLNHKVLVPSNRTLGDNNSIFPHSNHTSGYFSSEPYNGHGAVRELQS